MKIADFIKRQTRAGSPENFMGGLALGVPFGGSDRDLLFRVAIQVPAREIAQVRKYRANAGLIFPVLKDIFGLVVLLSNRVIAAYGDNPEGITLDRQLISEHGIVSDIESDNHAGQNQNRDDGDSFHGTGVEVQNPSLVLTLRTD